MGTTYPSDDTEPRVMKEREVWQSPASSKIMNKQPYEMTSEEFNQSFPLFTKLSPRAKWRCYRINNAANLQETGEECSWAAFVEFATSEPFRWDTTEMQLLVDERHEYFVKQALQYGWDIPSDVLAEYPVLVDEFIQKKISANRLRERRNEKRRLEKEQKAYEKQVSKADRDFWSNFQ